MHRPLATAAAAALLVSLAGIASAADMSKKDVKAKVEAAGYTKVSGIHKEKGHWDAMAMKDGKKVYLDIDAATGDVKEDTEESEKHEHHKKK